MNKRKKYIPGRQLAEIQEARQTIKKAQQALKKYYDDHYSSLENEQSNTVSSQTQKPTQEDQNVNMERTDAENAETQYSPAREERIGYTNESAEDYLNRTSDPTAFQDQFIPSILDPRYNEWAERQAARAAKKPDIEKTQADKVAQATVRLQKSFEQDIANGKELAPDRMNRRIRENNTFGKLSKGKALTDDEILEIDRFRIMTDPEYGWQRVKDLSDIADKIKAEEEAEQESIKSGDMQPSGYYLPSWISKASLSPYFGGPGVSKEDKFSSKSDDSYIKSFASDFILSSNEVQLSTAIGQIQRSKEFMDMANKAYRYASLMQEYSQNLKQIQKFDTEAQALYQYSSENARLRLNKDLIQNLSPSAREEYNRLLSRNKEIQQEIRDNKLRLTAMNLSSWEPTALGQISQYVDNVVDDDLGGIRKNLWGIGSKFDNLEELFKQNNHDSKWSEKVFNTTADIQKQLTEFNKNASQKQSYWKKQMLTDAQDIVDWRTGDNWMGLKANVDPYYEKQKTLLQRSGFSWNDPVQLAMYGWSGIAGGSNSSWWKSIISASSKGVGIIGGAMTSGGTSALIQGASMATSFLADKSAGSDEDNANVTERSSGIFNSKLKASGKYDEFIKEGEKQLKNIKPEEATGLTSYNQDVVKNTLDLFKSKEEKEQFILNSFLTGVWQSADPQITKMHADAVIGANNQFYNDLPVNTADAAIDAVATILKLEPVKFAAQSVRAVGKVATNKIANTALGKSAEVAFQGFKTGARNIEKRLAESSIAKSVARGIDKSYSGTKGAINSVGGRIAKNKMYIGIEGKVADAYQKVRSFATSVPSVWMKASIVGKNVANVGARMGVETGSEMLQEGVQALQQRDVDYDPQANRSMALRIFNDMLLAKDATYIWMHQNDPAMKAEAEVWSSMNAAPLLTLLGPNSLNVFVKTHDALKEMSMVDIINNNIDAARRGDVAELEQGRLYAKNLSKEDHETMLKKFDQFDRIAGSHRDAQEKLQKGVQQNALMNSDDKWIPSELIAAQKDAYEQIYNLAHSSKIAGIANRVGAKPGSDTFAKIVSLYSFRKNRYNEAKQDYLDKLEENGNLYGAQYLNDIIDEKQVESLYNDEVFYGTGQMDLDADEKQIRTSYDLAKDLARAKVLMQIINDYSSIQTEQAAKDDLILNRSKKQLQSIKDQLKKAGIEVDTEDQIDAELNLSDAGQILKEAVLRTRPVEDESLFTLSDYVEAYMDQLRDEEILHMEFLLQDQMLNDFVSDPQSQLQAWSNREKSDMQLEAILEENYINSIRAYEKAANREVKDGDVYVGYDGKWYITKKNGDTIEKHRYNPNTSTVDKEALPFSSVEYDEAKTTEEEAIKKGDANKKANENIQTGGVEGAKTEEELERGTAPTEGEKLDSFAIGDTVVTDDAGTNRVGVILDIDADGNATVSYGNGPVEVRKQSELKRANQSIKQSKYKQGEIIKTNDGRTYVVTDITLEDIDNDTYEPSYTYTAVNIDDDQDIVDMTASDIENLTKAKPVGNVRKTSEEQQKVLAFLKKKREEDEKTTKLSDGRKRRTGRDYLIRIEGKIQKFLRVHGVLDNIFDETESFKLRRAEKIHELEQIYNTSKQDFVKKVKSLQEEYNAKIEERFGKDGFEYEYYAIDLMPYIRGKIINDPDIIPSIASIVASEIPDVYVVVGSIIDEIARDFFDKDAVPQNKPKYRMSDTVFNQILEQLQQYKDRFKELNWIVDTYSYTWHGEFVGGIKMAGETDMIAIDLIGNIHVIDFKTTGNLGRFESRLEYKTEDLDGNEKWMEIDKENVPAGAETRISSPFLNELPVDSKTGMVGKRSYAAQYARQLEAYRLLIQQATGRKVTSIEVLPIYVHYESQDGVLKSIFGVKGFNLINLAAVPELQEDISDVDNYLLVDQAVSEDDIDDYIQQVEDTSSNIQSTVEAEGVSKETIAKLREVLSKLSQFSKPLLVLKNNVMKRSDVVYANGIIDNVQSAITEARQLLSDAEREIQRSLKNDGLSNEPSKPITDRSWINEPVEDVMPSESNRWWHFNTLHSFSDAVKNMKDYMKSTVESKFIENATFIIGRDDANNRDLFHVVIKYKGFSFGPIDINLGKNDAAPKEVKNDRTPEDRFLGVLGRNFLRQYYSLAKSLKPGERIVATKVTRTNGKLVYSDKELNLQNTQFLGENDRRLLRLINSEDSLVGVSDKGVVVSPDDRSPIYSPKTDLDGFVLNPKERQTLLPGNQDSQDIPSGSVVFIHKFKYSEDPEEAEERKVPIVLKGKYLAGKDGKPTKDSLLIVKILQDIAKSKSPKKELDALREVTVVSKDGSVRTATIPGLTNRKVLNLLVRFGGQAEKANDDFIFDFAKKESGGLVGGHKIIRITDMRKEAKEGEDGILHRDTIDLNIRNEEDVMQLYEILSKTQMHINQFGTMRAQLNTDDESSPFGALRTFFLEEGNDDIESIILNRTLQIDKSDVFPDENNPRKTLTGIAWAIKHGYATTNADHLENPLISIHELGKEQIDRKKPSTKKQSKSESKKQTEPKGEKKTEDSNVTSSKDEPKNIGTETVKDKPEKQRPVIFGDDSEKDALRKKVAALLQDDDDEDGEVGMGGRGARIVENLSEKPLSKEEKDAIEKQLRKLVGKVAVKWTPGAVEVLKSGAQVAGRTAVNAFTLSERMPSGTQFHEAFHKILEILIPNKRREKIYQIYRDKYNESFKRANGRDLTDRDISEDLAEMFRIWRTDKTDVKLHWNILKTFKEIRDYVEELRNLGDRRFAALFVLANSGIFRFVKPDQKNVEHFINVLGGQSDMRLTAKDKDGKIVSENFDMFPAFGGKALFDDAIEGIIYALFTNYSIDKLATNAARISTSRKDVVNLFRSKNDTTKHSSWFRVITGEYVDSDEKFTLNDAVMFYRLYKNSSDILDLGVKIIENNPKITGKELREEVILSIYEREQNRKKEDLNYNQKLMRQFFEERTWWMVERKINDKLHKMSIDSERRTEEDYKGRMDDGGDPDDETSVISKDVGDHKDEFYDHARTEDATAAVRFFLSTIPDERFATQDDVDAGIVKSLTKKDGKNERPVTISNSNNLLGFSQYLGMRVVSNKLLHACNKVQNVLQLNEVLKQLSKTDPMFERIYRRYNSALENEIVKWPDGKNKITLKGKYVHSTEYEQYRDEDGWYYVWNDSGEKPGERIVGAVTQTDPDMESFVTQMFNYCACQKLDFIMVSLQQEKDDDGMPIQGKYIAKVVSSDSDYAASVFPKTWFAKLRTGATGVFRVTSSGKYTLTEDGKQILQDAVDTLRRVNKAFKSSDPIQIHGREVHIENDEDFRYIESEFIKALNTLGITISREAFEYYLLEQGGGDTSIKHLFSKLLATKNEKISFSKFLQEMGDFEKSITASGKNTALTLDKDERTTGYGRTKQVEKRSGNYIYSRSSFVNWAARAVSRYNKATSEIMTNGPEKTKRYMFAQSHTASDITDDLNKAYIVDGEVKGSRIFKDMSKYIFNLIDGVKGFKKGSIILKALFNSTESNPRLNLVLHTHGGVKVENDKNGGQSYKKITMREDWIAKARILMEGGIIFPTLSDKSTWFYLTGVKVPGLDYSNIKNISSGSLLHIGIHTNQEANSTESHVLFDFSQPIPQIDQMIEYAECERALVEREINRGKKGTAWEKLRKLPVIEFFNDNRVRFGGLSEVVVIGKDKKARLELLNDYSLETPEQCLAKADQLFFNQPMKEKRRIMALTLETGFMENLALLQQTGLIVASNNLQQQVLDTNGNATGKTTKQSLFLQFKNIGLDSEIISQLKQKYISEYDLKDKNLSVEQSQRAESQAICQYVWDIYLRGIISNEETSRLYTGGLNCYKWKHKKFLDSLSGKVMDALYDAYSDFSKRLGGLGSTGDKNRTDLANMPQEYTCAEVEDHIVGSKIYESARESFIDNYVRDTYYTYRADQIQNNAELTDDKKTNMLDALDDQIYGENKIELEKIKQELEESGNESAYQIAITNAETDSSALKEEINVADGAAYITPQMAKNLLRQRGRFTSKVKEAFDLLEGKRDEEGKIINVLSRKEAYDIVEDAMLGAQKYSAYGYRINDDTDDIPVHYYNKFALFVLFPQFASGFTADILQKMQDQGVDMLMMHSAVKTGSQEAQECNPDVFKTDEEFKSFRFKTYKQRYAFIRRQLNTDPHKTEETSMATQMTKVALANLRANHLYITPDGRPIRGRDLLIEIMSSISALSDIGKEKIKEEFFTDGVLDIDKFSSFLESELNRRDADYNLIDGIEVVEDEKTHKRRFKVDLEAISSVGWIESIIVSKINKEVCDINVDGNAFYQRSVWGMEGKSRILGDKDVNFKKAKINGGNDLKLINEDGSMDAVVSIDFFKDIIPSELYGNFNASRQWLIDHEIISGTKSDGTICNAKANSIASRIPTQAQSSIHALRFVDVLPVVRATIILPKEFTKITGSDFDIDKLYIVRKHYSVNTQKVDGKHIDTVSDKFEKDTENYHKNRLIDGYLTLLKSHGKGDENGIFEKGDSIHISMRTVDGDTALWTNVLNRVNSSKPVERHYAYKFGNIAFQVKTKSAFMLGKTGVAVFALNNTNQILTQLYGIRFSKSEGRTNILDALGCLRLDNQRDKNGKPILSWTGGGLNINVDVAKNPERIYDSNLNPFVYNNILLLLRTGMGERALLFNMQPIMFELARVYEDATGQFMTDITKSKTARQNSAIKKFIEDYYKVGGTISADERRFINEMMLNPKNGSVQNAITEQVLGSYAKALFGIKSDGSYDNTFLRLDESTGEYVETDGCIFEDVITTQNVSSLEKLDSKTSLYKIYVQNRDGNTEEVYLSPKDVQLYTFFIFNALSKYSQAMGDLVNACKIDTKKQGKNYVEQQSYYDKYKEVFGNESGIFEQEGLDNLREKSYIERKTENAIGLYEDIFKQISMQSTDTFKKAHDAILNRLNSSPQNKELSRKVTNAIVTHFKLKFFRQYISEQGEDYFESLFYGKNSIQTRLLKLQNAILRDKSGKFSKFGEHGDITLGEYGQITNPLLKALQLDVYDEKEDFLHPQFVKLENALLDDSDNANALERAWDELYRDEYHYTIDENTGEKIYYVKQFAIDLAIYAFLTSGDRQGSTMFFKYVPNSIRTQLISKKYGSYSDYMVNLRQQFEDGSYVFDDDEINDIIGENWEDNDFVKEIKMTIRKKGDIIAVNTSYGSIFRSEKKNVPVKTGKKSVTFVPKTIKTNTNIFIAGIKKIENNAYVSTINLCNDGNYPPYIKVRRPRSTKFDPDNFILYKFDESRLIDENDPTKGTYPIYMIINPTSASLRAGSYDYIMYDCSDGKLSPAYPIYIQEAVQNIFSDQITTEVSKDLALGEFIDALNNMGIYLHPVEIEQTLKAEFDYRGFYDITDSQLKAAVDYIHKELKIPEETDKKTTKKVVIESSKTKKQDSSKESKEDEDYSIDDIDDENEDYSTSNTDVEEQKPDSKEQPNQQINDEILQNIDVDGLNNGLSEEDFSAESICNNKTKK